MRPDLRLINPGTNFVLSIGENVHTNKLKRVKWSFKHLTEQFESPHSDKKGGKYFIGGVFNRNTRKRCNLREMTFLTLDLDNIEVSYQDAAKTIKECFKEYAFIMHTTHSHRDSAPRFRLVFPLYESVSADTYTLLARNVAKRLEDYRKGSNDTAWVDMTSFRPAQPMFFPTTAHPSEFHFYKNNASYLNCQDFLETQEFENVPYFRGENHAEDPLLKKGIVGIFCRAYTIADAIYKFLPDMYENSEQENRYTYKNGTSKNGVIVYDNGRFIFSHHGTDPAGGKLLNAFDLIRVHKFPATTLHEEEISYKKMAAFVQDDDQVIKQRNKDKREEVQAEFDSFPSDCEEDDDMDWLEELDCNKYGSYKPSFLNLIKILECDPVLKKCVRYNEFTRSLIQMKPVGYVKEPDHEWSDQADLEVRSYIDSIYKIETTANRIADAIQKIAIHHPYHPVHDFLNSLEWDGIPRVETFFQDYLNLDKDSRYYREVSRSFLVAAVSRVMNPGIKFDYVPILQGAQGIGKSTFWQILAKSWFSELVSFDQKTAVETMRGMWILEVPELDAFSRYEAEQIKQFFGASSDRFREPYARRAYTVKRQCVFVGTTNKKSYLKDETGNRRFWPIICNTDCIDLERLKNEVNQIWAEAYQLYQQNTPIILSQRARYEAQTMQESARHHDEWEDLIKAWLEQMTSTNRYDKDFTRYIEPQNDSETEKRDKVCVPEIWEDCLGGKRDKLNQSVSKRIRTIMDNNPNYTKTRLRFGNRFGRQHGYKKK